MGKYMNTRLKKILNFLEHKVFIKVKPSKVHGVGVFSIKVIPKDTKIFENPPVSINTVIDKSKLEHIDKGVLKWLEDIWPATPTKQQLVLKDFDMSCMRLFINHSSEPNVYRNKDGDYITLCNIEEDEELFINYRVSFDEFHTIYNKRYLYKRKKELDYLL